MKLTDDEKLMERAADYLIDYIMEREKREPMTRLHGGKALVQKLSARLDRINPFSTEVRR